MSNTMQIDLKVEMKEALSQLSRAAVEQMVTASLVSGALLIANKAKTQTPNVHGTATGTLKRSIHVGGHVALTPDFGSGQDYSDLGEPGAMRAIVGTNLVYAAIQEYGGTIKAKNAPYLVFKTADGQWHRVKAVTIPARPYLTPAMQTERDNAIKEIGAALEDLIQKKLVLR